MARSIIRVLGSEDADANIAFNSTSFTGAQTQNGNNISGTLTITNSVLSNGFSAGLDIQSDAGTVTNANVSNNTVMNPGTGTAGISFVGTGNASTSFSLDNATINQNTVTNAASGGIQISIGNSNATGPGATAGIPEQRQCRRDHEQRRLTQDCRHQRDHRRELRGKQRFAYADEFHHFRQRQDRSRWRQRTGRARQQQHRNRDPHRQQWLFDDDGDGGPQRHHVHSDAQPRRRQRHRRRQWRGGRGQCVDAESDADRD